MLYIPVIERDKPLVEVKPTVKAAIIAAGLGLTLSGCSMSGTVINFDENDVSNTLILAGGYLGLRALKGLYSHVADSREASRFKREQQEKWNEYAKQVRQQGKEERHRQTQYHKALGVAKTASERFEKDTREAREQIQRIEDRADLAEVARRFSTDAQTRATARKRHIELKKTAQEAKAVIAKAAGQKIYSGEVLIRYEGNQKITVDRAGHVTVENLKNVSDDYLY